jgi:hypothetical protein
MVGAENMTLETGFFHAERGYWQVTGEAADGTLSGYPAGTVEVPLRPDTRYDWDGSAWVLLVVDITIVRATAISAMLARINAFTATFTDGVPITELASWPTKATEAAKVIAGGSSAMITAEAEALGQVPMLVAETIVARSDLYLAIIGRVSGLRRKTEAAIAAATTAAQVDAAMQAALIEAQALAGSLGLSF